MSLISVKVSLSQEFFMPPEIVGLAVEVAVGSNKHSYTTMVRRGEFRSHFDIIWEAAGMELKKAGHEI